jgi:hypothetical protein
MRETETILPVTLRTRIISGQNTVQACLRVSLSAPIRSLPAAVLKHRKSSPLVDNLTEDISKVDKNPVLLASCR